MKAKRIGVTINEETFAPEVKYEITIPLEVVQDIDAKLSREEAIQKFGKDLLEALEKDANQTSTN